MPRAAVTLNLVFCTLQLVKDLQERKLPHLEKTVKRVRMQLRRSSPVRKHKESKIVSRAPISSREILRSINYNYSRDLHTLIPGSSSQLASDAGALVSMTESEKKRLEELLCGDNELEVSREKSIQFCLHA